MITNMNIQDKIDLLNTNFSKFLKEKNKRYGNSALKPLNIFINHKEENNKALNGILERLDDKLSRIKNSDLLRKNDVIDILGYVELLCISKDWLDFDEFLD